MSDTHNMKFEQLAEKVQDWARERQIIPNSTPVAQARKTLEEAGELLEAASYIDSFQMACDFVPIWTRDEWLGKFKDAAGDVMVTLINACALAGVDPVVCLAGAYAEIKDRKGTLRPDGVFVKEEA